LTADRVELACNPSLDFATFPQLEMALLGLVEVQAFVLIVTAFSFWLSRRSMKYSNRPHKHFDFLELPPELRLMVYEEVVAEKDLKYNVTQDSSSTVSNMIDRFRDWCGTHQKQSVGGLGLARVNRLVHKEFEEVLNKLGHFKFTFDQNTIYDYTQWNISQRAFENMRKCTAQINVTSTMLGANDPRLLDYSRPWATCQSFCSVFNEAKKLEDFELHIRAVPSPLWNPLWVSTGPFQAIYPSLCLTFIQLWHHASQHFKTNPESKVGKITFSLDCPSFRENHLERNSNGDWEWRCTDGHLVCADAGGHQLVRDFCRTLYQDCDNVQAHQPVVV
jgi:hypothetical protein